jgi:NitT/TauT family transport system substrate-binding protein
MRTGVPARDRYAPRSGSALWLIPTVVLAVSLVTGCRAEPEPPLRIGTTFWPSNELLFLAQENGWLDPSEFRLVEFVDDGEVMRAFRNHAVAAAWLSMDEVLAVAQSGVADPVILFVSDESHGGDAVVAHADLITPADLKDRRVAAQINSVGAYLLDRALRQAGLGVGDVRLVNLPPYRHLSAFRSREVDAVVTSEPVRSQVIDAGGVELFSTVSTPFDVLRALVVRRDYLESHQPQSDALCSAWQRAIDELKSSEKARSRIAERLNTSVDGLDRMLERVRVLSLSESREWLGVPKPKLLATLARLQSELLDAGLLPAPTALEPMLRWPATHGTSVCRG